MATATFCTMYLHFQQTGVIYRDLSQPPYLPAQYSPMLYVLYSLPGRLAASVNPFVGPRLVALTSFLACLAVLTSILRALLPRYGWVWGALLMCSIASMPPWLLQLRGDFPAIFFNLLAVRLLLSRSPRAALAGLSAGLATHFKLTFVAALAAGALWLLVQRRWKELATFAILGALSSGGLYLLLLMREPRMLTQILALSPGIVDVKGCGALILAAGRELVVPLAVLSLSSVAFRGARWRLMAAFVAISFVLAAVFDLQAGGNINYFFEALFAAVPLAALGVIRLVVLTRREPIGALTAAILLLAFFCVPRTREAYERVRARFAAGPQSVASLNEEFRAIEQTLRGQHIFSTVPRLALLDQAPALTEPYLLTYLERLGKIDPEPILGRVRGSEFDIVITSARRVAWRGLPHIAPDLHAAIAAGYQPHCVVRGVMIHFPQRPRRDHGALAQNLSHIGCVSPVRERVGG